jgi:Putative prokaryotic signal transducing protein
MAIQPTDDIVRLTVYGPDYGRFFQQLLQAEGIESQVVGDNLFPGFEGPLVSPELWVRRNDVERALAILEANRAAREPERMDGEPDIGEYGSCNPVMWGLLGIIGILFICLIIAAVVATSFFGWHHTEDDEIRHRPQIQLH